jgi:hypothetical protein
VRAALPVGQAGVGAQQLTSRSDVADRGRGVDRQARQVQMLGKHPAGRRTPVGIVMAVGQAGEQKEPSVG